MTDWSKFNAEYKRCIEANRKSDLQFQRVMAVVGVAFVVALVLVEVFS